MSKSRVLKTIGNSINTYFSVGGHGGVDLAWEDNPNEPIIAHSDGTVMWLQTGQYNNPGSSGNDSYGNCIKLKHANGYRTLYAHLHAVYVTNGQQVKKGDTIGLMGNTGNSYGNHLHFEVRNAYDDRINPAPYLNADLPGLPTNEEDDEMLSYDQFKAYMQQYKKDIDALPATGWFATEGSWQKACDKGALDGRPCAPLTRQETAVLLNRLGLLK